jgi:hypothetical protein
MCDLVQQCEEDAVELGDPAGQPDDRAAIVEESHAVDLAVGGCDLLGLVGVISLRP